MRVLFFSGKGGVSTLIKTWTNSDWSHVGLDLGLGIFFESTSLNGRGVQINDVGQRVGEYELVGQRRILFPARQKQVDAFIQEHVGKPYERHVWDLVGSTLRVPNEKSDASSIFCSELCAMWFKFCGMKVETPDSYSPADLAELNVPWLGPLEIVGHYSMVSAVWQRHKDLGAYASGLELLRLVGAEFGITVAEVKHWLGLK